MFERNVWNVSQKVTGSNILNLNNSNDINIGNISSNSNYFKDKNSNGIINKSGLNLQKDLKDLLINSNTNVGILTNATSNLVNKSIKPIIIENRNDDDFKPKINLLKLIPNMSSILLL